MQIRTIESRGLQVVVCLKFDHRAPLWEIERFKQSLMQCEHVTHSLETSGTFDFMVELAMTDYHAYVEKIASIAEPMAQLVERYETSFIARRFMPVARHEGSLWVPSREGLQRVGFAQIDWIKAEGDYVRICSGSSEWLVGMTMGALWERLDKGQFLKLHRSAIVRRDLIERLVHHGGRWEARLSDGTTQRIAKSQVSHTLKSLRGHPASVDAPVAGERVDGLGRASRAVVPALKLTGQSPSSHNDDDISNRRMFAV